MMEDKMEGVCSMPG